MNLDELMAVWKSQDAAPLHDMNKTLLHQALQRDEAELQKVRRIAKRIIYVVSAFLFLNAALFLAIMIDPNQPTTFSSRFIVWDYVVGGIGVAAAVTMAGAWFVACRSWLAREQGFGDSLRDHVRRRIAQLDADAAGELRLGLITVVATFICAKAIIIVAGRIKHVPVPWREIGEIDWPSPFWTILILGFFCLWFFRWMPRERRRNLSRKHQLEALLKELDGQ